MRRLVLGIATAGAVVLLASTSHAWRCGNLLVRPGVQKAAVLLYCGEPAYREDLGQRGGEKAERLIYGPEWGMYYLLTFQGGSLSKIDQKRAR